MVARSSVEVECYGLTHTTYELLWLESLLSKLYVSFLPSTIFYDHLSVALLSDNMVLHAQTKHIDLDIHFVRKWAVSKKMLVKHVSASTCIIDTLTKSLGTIAFQNLLTKLKIICLNPPYSCGKIIEIQSNKIIGEYQLEIMKSLVKLYMKISIICLLTILNEM